MQLLKIVSPFVKEGADVVQILKDIDVKLVMETRMTHGYGSMTDKILTATLEIRYQGEIIYSEEDYDITSG